MLDKSIILGITAATKECMFSAAFIYMYIFSALTDIRVTDVTASLPPRSALSLRSSRMMKLHQSTSVIEVSLSIY